ncbi:MAG: copper resistance CopC/CopD family protein [Gaiella sp.]
MKRAAVALGVVALLHPASAVAHATLNSTTPSVQSSVGSPPLAVVLRFDQSVTAVDRSIEVFAADGEAVAGSLWVGDRGRLLRASLAGVVRGAYTVRWRVLSADGHIGSGLFTFGVGVAAPPPTEAFGAEGLGWRDDIARWAAFVALAALLGPLVLRLVILRTTSVPARLEHAFHVAATVGAFAAINVSILAFVIRAENALQLGFVDLLYGNLEPFAEHTRFGIAFLVSLIGFAFVATLLLLAWVLDRPSLLWPALVGATLLASSFSLSGHQAIEPNSSVATQLADWAHLVAASIWAGGVVTLAALVWPLAPSLRRAAFLGFSRVATVLVAVLILAGVYLTIVRLPELADLWETGYGRMLLVKLSIVAVALGWGAAHHLLVRPRLERGDTPRGVGRSLVGEGAVAVAVLLVAAMLVNSSPPQVSQQPRLAEPAR